MNGKDYVTESERMELEQKKHRQQWEKQYKRSLALFQKEALTPHGQRKRLSRQAQERMHRQQSFLLFLEKEQEEKEQEKKEKEDEE